MPVPFFATFVTPAPSLIAAMLAGQGLWDWWCQHRVQCWLPVEVGKIGGRYGRSQGDAWQALHLVLHGRLVGHTVRRLTALCQHSMGLRHRQRRAASGPRPLSLLVRLLLAVPAWAGRQVAEQAGRRVAEQAGRRVAEQAGRLEGGGTGQAGRQQTGSAAPEPVCSWFQGDEKALFAAVGSACRQPLCACRTSAAGWPCAAPHATIGTQEHTVPQHVLRSPAYR